MSLASVFSFLVLGALNGSIIRGLANMSSLGGTAYNLFLYSIFGIVSIVGISFIGRILGTMFPQFWPKERSIIMQYSEAAGKDVSTGLKFGAYTGVVVVGGIANGMIYYLISDMNLFTSAGWLGSWVAGGLALFFYTLLAPFVQKLLAGSIL